MLRQLRVGKDQQLLMSRKDSFLCSGLDVGCSLVGHVQCRVDVDVPRLLVGDDASSFSSFAFVVLFLPRSEGRRLSLLCSKARGQNFVFVLK